MRIFGIMMTATVMVAMLTPVGCASRKEAECQQVKPGTVTTVNVYCAVMHDDPVDPSVKPASWKGQSVGFCCEDCIERWEKKSPAEKDASLQAAVAKGRPGK